MIQQTKKLRLDELVVDSFVIGAGANKNILGGASQVAETCLAYATDNWCPSINYYLADQCGGNTLPDPNGDHDSAGAGCGGGDGNGTFPFGHGCGVNEEQ
jgi:hypothetical protein